MSLCLRIDLDYVPWDTPDAAEFGHGEPAMVLKLLELARHTGAKYHAFASNRVLRAFPSTVEAFLNDGHDLDWLCKHPEQSERCVEALELLVVLGHVPLGLAVKGEWPEGVASPSKEFKFLSAMGERHPPKLKLFSVATDSDRESARSGTSAKTWAESVKKQIRDAATRNLSITVSIRPQVLAKYDPKLIAFREMIEIAQAVELPLRTLRDRISTT